jgi:hypothetical protein
MTIVEAIREAMLARGAPLTPSEVYDCIVADELYRFNALDPVHVVRSQIRRHCVGIDTASSSPNKHFERYPGGRFFPVASMTPFADGNGTNVITPSESYSQREQQPRRDKGTIVEAIRQVMEIAAKPMTAHQVYAAIVDRGLYAFRASEPAHVVRSQLRRHCLGLDFPSASEVKHFQLRGKDRYLLLPTPVRRKSQLGQIGLSLAEEKPRSGDEVQETLTRTSDTRDQVFVSYSQKDAKWMQRLQVHLKPLEKLGIISRWDDSRIRPGDQWREAIATALRRARVAILLVSADFLASDFISENELPPLLKAAAEEGVMILPVIVSPCRFEKTEGLSQYQAVNSPRRTLIALDRAQREDLFVKIADATEGALYPA